MMRRRRFRLSRLARATTTFFSALAALLLAVGVVRADVVQNTARTVPITVDGFASYEGEYGGAESLDYVSGSLYRGENDPRQNSLIYPVLARDGADRRGPYALFVRFDYLRRTTAFPNGALVGLVRFPISTDLGLTRRNITVTLRADSAAPGGCVGTFRFDDAGVGSPAIPIGQYGMKVALRLATGDLSATTPYLQVELKAPSLLIPRGFGDPFPNRGYPDGYYTPAAAQWTAEFATDELPLTTLGEQSSAVIEILPGFVRASNSGLDIRAEMDVKPGNADNIIGDGDNGVLVIAIVSQPQLGAADIDTSTVTVGDERTGFGRLAPAKSQLKDVNGDGVADWVFNFDLKTQTAFDLTTTVLEVRGLTTAGEAFSGKDRVTVR